MLNKLRDSAHFFDRKIGLSRIGLALSLTIIVVAVIVLYHILRDIDTDELFARSKRPIGGPSIVAGLFVAAGYLTLTFYDLFALRTIGRAEIPYRVAALAAFTSYAIGHNVGASIFSGGAVRYRIYSAWGLSVIEVTKICFIAGLTFWLGNATVLGLAFSMRRKPRARSISCRYGPTASSLWSFLRCSPPTSLWVWVKPRVIGRDGWQVRLPGGPLTLVQIAIGIVDLACCAAAMYMLVPDDPNVGFVTVAVIFVAATLLGFASHAPGGLGVFDAAMLVALWQFDKGDLLAGLLLFRLLYYIIPFVLSLAVRGARSLAQSHRAAHISIVAAADRRVERTSGRNRTRPDRAGA